MSEYMNNRRERALLMVAEYQMENPESTAITDESISWIVTDLRHLCDAHGVNWMDVIFNSSETYREEIEEEETIEIQKNKEKWEADKREIERDD